MNTEVENTDITPNTTYKVNTIFTSYQLVDELKALTAIPIYPIRRYSDKEEVKVQVEILLKKR